MQKRVMVLVHCTSSYEDLSYNEISKWYFFVFLCPWENLRMKNTKGQFFVCLVLCFKSQSTAMVISWRSVHLTTLFFSCKLVHILSLVAVNTLESAEERRMAVKIFHDQSQRLTKVWDQEGIKLMSSGSSVRHVTDCVIWLGTTSNSS